MSNDINKIVNRIRKDVCEDCENKCKLCELGVCEDVITEIGCFFWHCAKTEKEQE